MPTVKNAPTSAPKNNSKKQRKPDLDFEIQKRNIVRWSESVDIDLLLAFYKHFKQHFRTLDLIPVAKAMGSNFTPGAIEQHLSKMMRKRDANPGCDLYKPKSAAPTMPMAAVNLTAPYGPLVVKGPGDNVPTSTVASTKPRRAVPRVAYGNESLDGSDMDAVGDSYSFNETPSNLKQEMSIDGKEQLVWYPNVEGEPDIHVAQPKKRGRKPKVNHAAKNESDYEDDSSPTKKRKQQLGATDSSPFQNRSPQTPKAMGIKTEGNGDTPSSMMVKLQLNPERLSHFPFEGNMATAAPMNNQGHGVGVGNSSYAIDPALPNNNEYHQPIFVPYQNMPFTNYGSAEAYTMDSVVPLTNNIDNTGFVHQHAGPCTKLGGNNNGPLQNVCLSGNCARSLDTNFGASSSGIYGGYRANAGYDMRTLSYPPTSQSPSYTPQTVNAPILPPRGHFPVTPTRAHAMVHGAPQSNMATTQVPPRYEDIVTSGILPESLWSQNIPDVLEMYNVPATPPNSLAMDTIVNTGPVYETNIHLMNGQVMDGTPTSYDSGIAMSTSDAADAGSPAYYVIDDDEDNSAMFHSDNTAGEYLDEIRDSALSDQFGHGQIHVNYADYGLDTSALHSVNYSYFHPGNDGNLHGDWYVAEQ